MQRIDMSGEQELGDTAEDGAACIAGSVSAESNEKKNNMRGTHDKG